MKALAVIGGIFAAAAIVVVAVILGWGARANSLAQNKVFAPMEETVRRETFEQSKAYQQGMVQELQNMQFEYAKADADGKKAMASIILHRASDYRGELPSDLAIFISGLRAEKSKSKF